MSRIPSSVLLIIALSIGAIFIFVLAVNRGEPPGNPYKTQTTDELLTAFGDDIKLPLEVMEFFDYRCSHCANMHSILSTLENDYKGKITLIPKHFPLPVVSGSSDFLAYGAEAAREQGKFRKYHETAMGRQTLYLLGNLDESELDHLKIAKAAGLNIEKYKKDFKDSTVRQRVVDDYNLGISLGITGTPTVFIEGIQVSQSTLNEVIDALIKKAEANIT